MSLINGKSLSPDIPCLSTAGIFDLAALLKAVEVWGRLPFVPLRDTEDVGLTIERIPVVDDETFAETVRDTAVRSGFAGTREVFESGFGAGTPAPDRVFPVVLFNARAELADLTELLETSLWRWGGIEAVVAADDGATLLAGRTVGLLPNSAREDCGRDLETAVMGLGAFLFKIRCREVARGVFSLSDADAVSARARWNGSSDSRKRQKD
jgi:hypothetical protein